METLLQEAEQRYSESVQAREEAEQAKLTSETQRATLEAEIASLRAEVAAAHIRPVEASGPDIVSNGIALSGTAHWMFDRGLISLADNLELVSRQTNDLEGVRSIINKSGTALAPRRISDRPHPHFLKWHREHCFKQ